MKNSLYIAFLVLTLSLFSSKSQAQIDSTILMCQSHMQLPYISDGQFYTALLNGDEIAEFHATFYGGSTYRLSAYCGTEEGNLVFSVYDQERNLLFTNLDFENTPYWDFEFDYSMDCIIEASLDSKNLNSGIAVLLIGFKQ